MIWTEWRLVVPRVPLEILAFALLSMSCAGGWPTLFGGAATPTPPVVPGSVRAALELAREAVNDDLVNFGGAFYDQSGTLVVLFVGDEGEGRERLDDLLPVDAPVSWRRVTHSAADLWRIQEEIVEMPSSLDVFSYVAVDTINNRVHVALQRENQQVVAQLRARYGDAVTFSVEPLPEPLYSN